MKLVDLLAEMFEENKVQPRVHGNGYVQLDLTPRKRLHVWGDSRIPRQLVPSTIHDHTFSFSSIVLKGQIIHRCIELEENILGGFQMYTAVTNIGEDTRLVINEKRFNAIIISEQLLKQGDAYTFEKRKFHETIFPWACITIIDKDGPTLTQGGPNPNVLVPYGLRPDNAFNRHQVRTDKLWEIIWDAIGYKDNDWEI
jgi:hypothetical protein